MMWKIIFLLCASLLFLSCGPKLSVCISDPQSLGFQCHDHKNNKDFFKAFEDSENDVCMPPLDYGRVIENCRQTGVKITACISDPPEQGFQCYDAVANTEFFLLFNDSENYVCLSPRDYLKLLDYCQAKD